MSGQPMLSLHPQESARRMKHDMGGHGMEPKRRRRLMFTEWAQPSVSGASVFVACNKSDDIVEIDTAGWKVLRRIPARPGVYNLTTTKDGTRLISTNKRDQSVSVIDLKSGRELARIPTRRKVLHGVVVSPDDRYAFVTVEGIGSEPGTVEIIDLATLRVVATVDVPKGAGIDSSAPTPPGNPLGCYAWAMSPCPSRRRHFPSDSFKL